MGYPIDIGDDRAVIRADGLRQRPNAAELKVCEPSVVETCQGQSGRLPEETERVVHALRFEGVPVQHRQCEWHILGRFFALTGRHDDHLQTASLISFGWSAGILGVSSKRSRCSQSRCRSSCNEIGAHETVDATW